MKEIIILCLMLAVLENCIAGSESENAKEKIQGLYSTLRSVAFPQPKTGTGILESRFLLIMPGKVLNYFDYQPGSDYINFIQVGHV